VNNAEDAEPLLNPEVIMNWPRKAEIDAAKSEWYSNYGEGKEENEVANLTAKSKRAQEKAEAEKILKNAKPDASIETAIVSRLLTGGKVLSIADGLFSTYKDKYDKDEMITLLTSIDGKFNAPLIKNVINAILHGVDGRKSSWG
jgi:hypothetical protein